MPDQPEMTQVETKVSELSINFDDYHPDARAEHEGRSLFVGLHVPIEFAKHLTLSSVVIVTISTPPAGGEDRG